MHSHPVSKSLAEKILEILGKGITLSDAVVQYIDSTIPNKNAKELEDILQDDSNCEKDSLVELLFFPDETLQYQLEDFLESQHFNKEDEEEVLRYLCQRPLYVSFRFPGKRGSFSLEVSESTAGQFIKRLNISKQVDRKLLQVIRENVDVNHRNRFTVKIRNSRFTATDKAVSFLCAFFEKWDGEKNDVFKYFDFVSTFLEELAKDADIFDSLMRKREFYLKQLKRTERFEEELQRTNIETLMLQGKRAAFMDKNEAREKMALIDAISHKIFGKTTRNF